MPKLSENDSEKCASEGRCPIWRLEPTQSRGREKNRILCLNEIYSESSHVPCGVILEIVALVAEPSIEDPCGS